MIRWLIPTLAIVVPWLGACATGAVDSGVGPDDRSAVEASEAVYAVAAEACGTGIEQLGSGVAVADDLIATVAHTLDGSRAVTVTSATGTVLDVDPVWIDLDRDLALLRVDGAPIPWLELGSLDHGENEGENEDQIDVELAVEVVTAVGEEWPSIKTATVVRAVEVTLDGEGARAGLELEADIEAGDSGAPVIAPDGTVIGIVFAANRGDSTAWAIAAKEIEAALAQPKGGLVSLSC